MSYNPNRFNGKKQAKAPERAAISFSDISRKNNLVGSTIADQAIKEDSKFGLVSNFFNNSDFNVKVEIFYSGKSTDYGHNTLGSKFIYVLSGKLYVTKNDKDDVLTAGKLLSLAVNDKYSYGAATEEAEVLVVESADYNKTWVVDRKVELLTSHNTVQLISKNTGAYVHGANSEATKKQSEEMANQRKRINSRKEKSTKKDVRFNDATSVIGISPMPATVFPED